jgi:hypothetical protein
VSFTHEEIARKNYLINFSVGKKTNLLQYLFKSIIRYLEYPVKSGLWQSALVYFKLKKNQGPSKPQSLQLYLFPFSEQFLHRTIFPLSQLGHGKTVASAAFLPQLEHDLMNFT